MALSLLKASGRGYRLLAKIFALPSRRTLTNLLNQIPFTTGINNILMDSLKSTVSQMTDKAKCCAILFEEMSLDCNVQYNKKDDCIEGIQDFGNVRHPELADHVNVFMLRGIFSQWKQPLAFTFTNRPIKSAALKTLIIEVISACQIIGLHVVASICDQGSANQAAINSLLKDTKDSCLKSGTENKYSGFVVNNQEIIPLYDVPHLFKGMRNNLLDKDLHFSLNNKGHVAKWSHIEQFYYLDMSEEDRICPKLTRQHVVKENINKMKVSCCTQVFSYQVGSLMKRVAQWDIAAEHKLEANAVDTAELILFLDKLFDSVNSSNRIAPSSKPLKGAVTNASSHEEFWRYAITVLQNMKFFNSRKNQFVQVPSIKNLIFTLRGFLCLKEILLSQFKFRYILTRSFNQDPLENFFSYIRSHGVRHVSPGVTHFISSFKSLLTNNFLSTHSPNSNCEEDFSHGALNNLKRFLTTHNVRQVPSVSNEQGLLEIRQDIPLNRVTRIGRCTLVYITGFLANKLVSSIVTCKDCRSNLLSFSEFLDTDFIEARRYRNSNLTKPGSFLYFIVSQSFPKLYYLIPRLCHCKNISAILETILKEKINFTPINCSKHDIGHKVCRLIVKCSLYFWCKKVNNIAHGKDLKFVKFLEQKPNPSLVDPVKLEAYRKFTNRIKRKPAKVR